MHQRMLLLLRRRGGQKLTLVARCAVAGGCQQRDAVQSVGCCQLLRQAQALTASSRAAGGGPASASKLTREWKISICHGTDLNTC